MSYFGTLLLCLILLCLIIYKVITNSNRIVHFRYYIRTLFYAALLCFLNLITIYIDRFSLGEINIIRYILYALIIITICLVSFGTLKYSEAVNDTTLLKNKFKSRLLYVPIVILVSYLLISYFIGINNSYILGKYYYICFFIIDIYWLFIIFKSIRRIKNKELILLERKNKTILTFAIILFIANNITIFKLDIPCFVMAVTIGFIYSYLDLLEQLITVDPLTKINNRGQLMNILEHYITNYDNSKSLYLLMMDLDYFKSINDKYGHVEGDKALTMTANLLKRICSQKNCFLARYGGDEFSIVIKVKEKEEIEELINNIQNVFDEFNKSNITPYNLLISVGYAKYDRRYKDASSLIALADESLYSNKKMRKEKMKEMN